MPGNLVTTSAYACKDFGRGRGEGVVVGLRVGLEWIAMFRREMKLGFMRWKAVNYLLDISFLRNQDKNSTQPSESPYREGWLEMERGGKRGWMARGREDKASGRINVPICYTLTCRLSLVLSPQFPPWFCVLFTRWRGLTEHGLDAVYLNSGKKVEDFFFGCVGRKSVIHSQ